MSNSNFQNLVFRASCASLDEMTNYGLLQNQEGKHGKLKDLERFVHIVPNHRLNQPTRKANLITWHTDKIQRYSQERPGRNCEITFWKSTNRDLLVSRRNLLLLAQTGFLQMLGCVYLNCCSTSFITVWQSRHRKVPLTSSGWTGWVRTTCPLIRVSEPIRADVSSRILLRERSQV